MADRVRRGTPVRPLDRRPSHAPRDWRDAFRQGGQGFAVRVQKLLERRGHYKAAMGIYDATLSPEIERVLVACAVETKCM